MIGTDIMGRCLACGKKVESSAGCDCQRTSFYEFRPSAVDDCNRVAEALSGEPEIARLKAENAKLRENAARLEPLLEACAELANAAEDDEHEPCDLDGAVDKLAGELFKYRNPEAFTKG